MQLTPKLLAHLNRVFNRDPEAFQALTIDFSDPMTWEVRDAHLLATVAGNPGMSLDLELLNLDLQDVADALIAAGYTASISIGDGGLSAMALIDGTGVGAQDVSGFRSLLWCFINAAAYQLQLAGDAIPAMLDELRLDLADGEWLDFWLRIILGSLRLTGETDPQLLARIISTVLLVKSNNRALEQIVLQRTSITVQVVDMPWLEADDVTVDGSVLTQFSLSVLDNGWPAWGNPANNNPMQCAFAVLFSADATCAEFNQVMPLIDANRSAGTYGIAYQRAHAFRTNTLGDTTNTLGRQIGPKVGTFAPMAC